MSANLDSKIKKKLKTSKLALSQRAELLRLVKRARQVTRIRNKLVHSVWACEHRKPLMLRDGTRKPESIPSMTTLKEHAADIDDIRNQLNKLTKALL